LKCWLQYRGGWWITNPSRDTRDTSYNGLESSIGSEDVSDAFAKELQKAASLDQQAWDEYQRRKGALDENQSMQNLNRESPNNNTDRDSTKVCCVKPKRSGRTFCTLGENRCYRDLHIPPVQTVAVASLLVVDHLLYVFHRPLGET
jgi:hypothetical protein